MRFLLIFLLVIFMSCNSNGQDHDSHDSPDSGHDSPDSDHDSPVWRMQLIKKKYWYLVKSTEISGELQEKYESPCLIKSFVLKFLR